jgi:predicted amidohydrolase YtcJ
MRFKAFVFAALAGIAAACSSPARPPASLVLKNGKIVTVSDAKPEAQAIAVQGDTIAAVGTTEEIAAYVGPDTEVVDLGG